jgi:hypothetical protein
MFLQKQLYLYQNNSNGICSFLSISTSVTFSIFSSAVLYYSYNHPILYHLYLFLKTILYPSIHLFHAKPIGFFPKSDSNFAPSIDRPPPQSSYIMIFSCSIKHYFLLKHSRNMYCIFNMIIVKFLLERTSIIWTIILFPISSFTVSTSIQSMLLVSFGILTFYNYWLLLVFQSNKWHILFQIHQL